MLFQSPYSKTDRFELVFGQLIAVGGNFFYASKVGLVLP